jgi:hypothetical protein
MGGVYSYENFLLTFNTDDPRAIVETFGLTELNKPSIFKDIVATWSLAVFLSIEDNGVLTTEGYLDFHRFDIRKFTVFLTQQRRARRDKVPLSTSTVKAIPGTWIFRRKRSPDDTITKWKARWVLRGDLQVADFDSYASVVAWSTVRIFMVLGLILRWTLSKHWISTTLSSKLQLTTKCLHFYHVDIIP